MRGYVPEDIDADFHKQAAFALDQVTHLAPPRIFFALLLTLFDSLQPRGGGYWVWKPWIIVDTLRQMKENDVLVYVDSGQTVFALPLHSSLMIFFLHSFRWHF